jgi:hypothetical protein
MFKAFPLAAILLLCFKPSDACAVTGRYVRYEAPTEFRDFLADLEVYSQGREIRGSRTIEATAYRGVPWAPERLKHLVNGVLTDDGGAKRPPLFEASNSPTNVCIEVDLSESQDIDEVKVSHSGDFTGPIRLVTVLDENRKVVGSSLLILERGQKSLNFPISTQGPYVGRTVPPGPGGWLPFGGLLPDHEAPPASSERLAAFQKRNDPQNTEALARRFFGLMNFDAPYLAPIREAYAAGQFERALELYRDLWFSRIAETENLWGHEIPGAHYSGEAEDLLAGRFSTARFHDSKTAGVMVSYPSGGIPWGYLPEGDLHQSFLAWNRDSARANRFARPLLTAYRKTGDLKYLKRWEEATDDLCMHFSAAADGAAEIDLRDYFVKDTLQNWNFFLFELASTAKEQPQFVSQFSPQTLARLLLFAQEEYLAPYWRTARKTAFNHTFNALNAAYFAVESFRDFIPGRRLMRETQDHFERVVSYNTTRDGSMTEIGDDGHIAMHMRLGIPLRHILTHRPDWISPQLLRQLQDRFAEMTRFQIRHLTSAGLGHRGGYADGFDSAFLDVDESGRRYGGMDALPMYQDRAVYRDPAVRANLEAMFNESPHEPEIRKFYASESVPAGQPVVSDNMPYAGLSYLRNHLGQGASSAHMVSPPVDHPSANSIEQTGVWLLGKGAAMVYLGGVKLNRESPEQELGRPFWKPGSKTDRLTQSSPDPIPARWYSGRDFDLAEAIWHGPYGRIDGANPNHPYPEVETKRFLITYRPSDWWVIVDQINVGQQKPPVFRFNIIPTVPVDQDVTREENGVQTAAGNLAGQSTHVFASSALTIKDLSKAEKPFTFRGEAFPKGTTWVRRNFELNIDGKTNTLAALTFIQPFDAPTIPATPRELTGLPEGGAGFEADLPDGGKFAVLASSSGAAALSYGTVSAKASLLVVAIGPTGVSGLVLDAEDLRINNQAASGSSRDMAFQTSGSQITTEPILRPLSPPAIAPTTSVFVDEQKITMLAPDSEASIYYTTDGSDPIPGAPGTQLYEQPIAISATTLVKARTVRTPLPAEGIIPFRADGTRASAIVHATYEKQTPLPATPVAASQPGLKMEFLHDTWLRLFSFLDCPNETKAEKSITVTDLLDPADFKALRDGDRSFGLRYSGYLDIPQDGVYTFHLPDELARHRSAVPGYDLQVELDGQPWNPDFTWQGGGNWSVPLTKGLHTLKVIYAEARTRAKASPQSGLWRGFPADHAVWKGEVPELKISGPGIETPQRIPVSWLKQP